MKQVLFKTILKKFDFFSTMPFTPLDIDLVDGKRVEFKPSFKPEKGDLAYVKERHQFNITSGNFWLERFAGELKVKNEEEKEKFEK